MSKPHGSPSSLGPAVRGKHHFIRLVRDEKPSIGGLVLLDEPEEGIPGIGPGPPCLTHWACAVNPFD